EPDRVIGALLGQHGVGGSLGRERGHEKVVGLLVSRRFSLGSGGVGELGADIEQERARIGRQLRGHLVIRAVRHSRLSRSSITDAASSSGARSGVRRRSGFFGRWYGLSIPVKWVISPARAFAYSPFGSRRSQSSSGVSQNTSKKSRPAPGVPPRASARCSSSGLIAGTRTT